MKLLVDSNVFLEVLLSDPSADEARKLLDNVGEHDLFV
jgi:predicted nucleic acid-binding protein